MMSLKRKTKFCAEASNEKNWLQERSSGSCNGNGNGNGNGKDNSDSDSDSDSDTDRLN